MHDRDSIRELFDFTTFTWAAYRRAVSTLPPDAWARELPGNDWRSLRRVMFHLALGWDGWLRDRVGASDPLDLEAESIGAWEDLQPHRQKVRGWLRRVIDETSDRELSERTHDMQGWPGGFRASVGEILTHILLHERGHHCDVGAVLSALGANVPDVDFLVWRWFAARER